MPSLQFVITDRMSLLSPLNSNGRSMPEKKNTEETGQNKCCELNLAIFVGTYTFLFYETCSVPCFNVGDVAQW